MIYLNCEVKSGLGEDTFWIWFKREFPNSSFDVPKKLNDEDLLLRYSTLGFLPIEGKQMALCWELYPEMKETFKTDYFNNRMSKVMETARYSTYRSVATIDTVQNYSHFGNIQVIPIGVDTDLYKPLNNKDKLRKKYNISKNKTIGIWIGTTHPMKGFSNVIRYASENPNIEWILIWKWEIEALNISNAHNFIKIPQKQICELLNCADFFLSTSQLKPYYMAEWEAMATDIPFVFYGNVEREFIPGKHPREDVFSKGWDRKTVKQKWINFFKENGVKW
jgi:glycosyltransferase involved in cell wall biosynthesis